MPPIAAVWIQRAVSLAYRYFYGLRELPVQLMVRQSSQPELRRSARLQKPHCILLPTEVNRLPARRNHDISTCCPLYKLIHLWNALNTEDISVGLSHFRGSLSEFSDNSRLRVLLADMCSILPVLSAYLEL